MTLTYDGKSFAVDDDALVCNACGEELIGERATAFLLTDRGLAPHADMTAAGERAACGGTLGGTLALSGVGRRREGVGSARHAIVHTGVHTG